MSWCFIVGEKNYTSKVDAIAAKETAIAASVDIWLQLNSIKGN